MTLDREATETLLASALPRRARWMVEGVPLSFEFTVARHGLQRLPDAVVAGAEEAEFNLVTFGERDFADGSGSRSWLCVSERDGLVYGFDPEQEQPLLVLNSSAPRFVATFQTLNGFLSEDAALPTDCDSRFLALDPEAYPKSEWRLLVAVLSQKPMQASE